MTEKEKFLMEVQICDRAEKLGLVSPDKRLASMIDIGYAADVFQMDIEAWLNAGDSEFQHEFLGIGMNIDRENINATHKADESCFGDFVPRFGKELP